VPKIAELQSSIAFASAWTRRQKANLSVEILRSLHISVSSTFRMRRVSAFKLTLNLLAPTTVGAHINP